MTRSHKVLGFLFVLMLGLYGCARGPGGSPAATTTAALEAKVQRLEEDFRAAATARDAFRTRLQAAEDKQNQTQRQLDQTTAAAARERQDKDAARAELKARTAERDNLQVQYDGFRRNIKQLIGQAESALNGTSANPVAGNATDTTTVSHRN